MDILPSNKEKGIKMEKERVAEPYFAWLIFILFVVLVFFFLEGLIDDC